MKKFYFKKSTFAHQFYLYQLQSFCCSIIPALSFAYIRTVLYLLVKLKFSREKLVSPKSNKVWFFASSIPSVDYIECLNIISFPCGPIRNLKSTSSTGEDA